MTSRSVLLLCCGLLAGSAAGGESLLANGDFENGLTGWQKLWSRTPNAGKAALDTESRHGGRQAVRVEHTGAQDWSLAQEPRLPVRPGQVYEYKGWVRVQGSGRAELSVVLADEKGGVLNWLFAGRRTGATADWRLLRSRFVIPPGAASMQARLTGNGPATVWLDDASLTLEGSMDELRAKNLPETLKASNDVLEVTLHTADGRLTVLDRRTGKDGSAGASPSQGTGQKWEQRAGGATLAVLDAKALALEAGFDVRLLDPASMLEIAATVRLDPKLPEVTVELAAKGELANPLAFPPPFVPQKGSLLILPVNEGISYPADDASLPSMHYHLYGGHGLSMAWWGMTDGESGAGILPLSRIGQAGACPTSSGVMAIVETPDDAAVAIPRLSVGSPPFRGSSDGLLHLAPEWQPQKGQFGPKRVIRYVFFDRGGYVAMAKRYREYAKQIGLLKTLAEKRKANPNIDRLVGAVNVWCWEKDAVGIVREMQAAGIRRILWSNARPPDQLEALNDLGVLTSRYDIYQDTMDPANFPKLQWHHGDWTTEAWANGDLMIDAAGNWIRGWEVETKVGQASRLPAGKMPAPPKEVEMIPCGVLCDRQAPAYARRRIAAELRTHPYLCRFIDTTTASPWRECYDPRHPCTRSESRQWRTELLRYVSQDVKLVCGSETGHDAAVPYVHYFEGMLSLGPYRVDDSGRHMQRILDDVPERVAKFQTGHFYRLPLWELVYHDCVVAQWYWGDYSNKLPKLWDRRDLWNALYGTPPMFMFNKDLWTRNRDRFVQSYHAATTVAHATGYAEMTSHRWLTPDHAVQETRFANGVTVTVNFGDQPYVLPDGTTLSPLSQRISGQTGD